MHRRVTSAIAPSPPQKMTLMRFLLVMRGMRTAAPTRLLPVMKIANKERGCEGGFFGRSQHMEERV